MSKANRKARKAILLQLQHYDSDEDEFSEDSDFGGSMETTTSTMPTPIMSPAGGNWDAEDDEKQGERTGSDLSDLTSDLADLSDERDQRNLRRNLEKLTKFCDTDSDSSSSSVWRGCRELIDDFDF